MKHKLLLIFLLLFVVTSCTGIGGKRSEKSDEFLIEKKNPLVMPPDINELPKPKGKDEIEKNENNFKETLKSKSRENENFNSENIGTLEELIIKKID